MNSVRLGGLHPGPGSKACRGPRTLPASHEARAQRRELRSSWLELGDDSRVVTREETRVDRAVRGLALPIACSERRFAERDHGARHSHA